MAVGGGVLMVMLLQAFAVGGMVGIALSLLTRYGSDSWQWWGVMLSTGVLYAWWGARKL